MPAGFVKIGFWWNGSTSPAFSRGGLGPSWALANLNRSSTNYRHATANGSLTTTAGGCCLAGSQLRGPSRVAGFPLVGFGAEVTSGSSDSTMAISSPGSRSEARDGRR